MAINKRRQKQASARPGRPPKFNPQLNMKKMQDKRCEETNAIDVNIPPAYLENCSSHSVSSKPINLLPHSPPVSTNIAKKCTTYIDSPSKLQNNKPLLLHQEVSPSSQSATSRVSENGGKRVSKKNGNRVLDLDSLVSIIENNTVCKSCGCSLSVEEETVGISTSIKIKCNSKDCGIENKTDNDRTYFSGNKRNYNSMESFATNVLLVLALQQIGAGASDCGLLLSYLNLPSAASFQSKSLK